MCVGFRPVHRGLIEAGGGMRILFVAGAGAHASWIVPVVWAAQLAGHETRVAVRPSGVRALTDAGLAVVPVGDEGEISAAQARHTGLASMNGPRALPAGWVGRPDLLPKDIRVTMASRGFAAAEMMAGDLVAFAKAWRPELVVYDTAALAGLVAAATLKVPAIGHTWGYSFDFSYNGDDDLRPGYTRLFTDFGTEPVDPAWWIDPCPPSLRLAPYSVPCALMRPVPYGGPAVVPPWLTEPSARPRVCLTGGVGTTALARLHDGVVAAAGEAGCEVVVTATAAQRELLGEQPPEVRVVDPFPLHILLTSCDAVIHHGGVLTGLAAVAAGLPQLVLPQTAATEFWGERVSSTGIGATLDSPEDIDVAGLHGAVRDMLSNPGYRERTAEVRREMQDMPSPGQIVSLIEEYLKNGRLAETALLSA
jgi:EryCIII-like glycosyltransferase